MTRNHNSNLAKRAYSPTQSTRTLTNGNDDSLVQLPDLSGLRDDEKQHILNVLLRDENLRNKHLSRFMYVSFDTFRLSSLLCLNYCHAIATKKICQTQSPMIIYFRPISGNLERTSPILNKDHHRNLHPFVHDVKQRSVSYSIQVIYVLNVMPKCVNNAD
jgi:hypothetical protein